MSNAAKKMRVSTESLPAFSRDFFGSAEVISYIGPGEIGGKASGLAFAKDILAAHFVDHPFGPIEIGIPRMVVLATGVFDRFMERNKLYEVACSDMPDERIAYAFQKADFPAEFIGDLQGLISAVHTPLAIRSSSLLEDAMFEPFAGVYETKMIPNNQADVMTRFHRLVEAIKFVYASVFFRGAKDYIKITGNKVTDEKMAVIIQEVVGSLRSQRYYPTLAGVARSHNFYPMGRACPEDGVVDLALGLGKTIVDGGLAWSYCPAYPQIAPPTASPSELLKLTQTQFWAVNMGKPPDHDPIKETEFLIKGTLAEAEYDGALDLVASTYRAQDDRMVMGTGSDGPRAVTFAPILDGGELPLNELLKVLLKRCEETVGSEVEIEFALTTDPQREHPPRFGFLQVRPMVVSHGKVDVSDEELLGEKVLAGTTKALGNGLIEDIRDVVYVKPQGFEAKFTRLIAEELATINRQIVDDKVPYLLIGFGRWGSSDPWLGIPVEWSQISGARVIIEATLPTMDIELSQGSHFFHNLTSFQVCYLAIHHAGDYQIDWAWLDGQPEVSHGDYVRHVRLQTPLKVKVDGRSGRGVISHD